MSDSNTPSQKVIDIQENLPKLISTTPAPSAPAYSSIKAAKTNPNTIPLLSRTGHSYCYIPDDFASYSCKKNEVIILISAHGENLSCYTRDLATNEILLSSFDTFNSPRNIRSTRIIRLPGIGVMSETISNTVLPIIVESITKNKCSEHNFNNIFQLNKKEMETRFNSQMSACDYSREIPEQEFTTVSSGLDSKYEFDNVCIFVIFKNPLDGKIICKNIVVSEQLINSSRPSSLFNVNKVLIEKDDPDDPDEYTDELYDKKNKKKNNNTRCNKNITGKIKYIYTK